jgi:predicted short-subunit dehydrogenase-like oxidoreductase (DUF2520 family)
MKVIIIGTGNVATVLGKKILQAGHEIIQVAGRNFEKANELGGQLHCNVIYNVRYINLGADIYIIAVSDASIGVVAAQLKLQNHIVAHTAAAVSKDVLAKSSENFGVIYPLQTLVKEAASLPSIPALIDGNNETTKKTLTLFANDWAESVRVANDEERLKLHIAAIFANNFTNYLFTIVEQFCKKEQLKFNILLPLIEETIKRLKTHSPSGLQTGPAVRSDYETIEKHKEILKDHPELSGLYNLLTNSIINFYNSNTTLNSNS